MKETGVQKIKCVGCGCVNEFSYDLNNGNVQNSITVSCPYCQAKNTIIIKPFSKEL